MIDLNMQFYERDHLPDRIILAWNQELLIIWYIDDNIILKQFKAK